MVLRRHANYGVVKIWKYQPGTMSQAEKIQFAIGALIWLGFPFPFLMLGHEYSWAFIGLCTALSATFPLLRNVCGRCINTSCPRNSVPHALVNSYLGRNPEMPAAWKTSAHQQTKHSTRLKKSRRRRLGKAADQIPSEANLCLD
jgi:hypothetical protein